MLCPVHPGHHRRRQRRLSTTSEHDDDYGGGGSLQNAAFAPNAARARRGGVNQLICCALPSEKLKSPISGGGKGKGEGAGWKKDNSAFESRPYAIGFLFPEGRGTRERDRRRSPPTAP